DQNECHITALQMFSSLNHAELFRQQSSLPLTADSCRVDQPEIETIVFQFGVNSVPGRARQGRVDGAFLTKQPVEQRRLADIRVPYNGNLDGRLRSCTRYGLSRLTGEFRNC